MPGTRQICQSSPAHPAGKLPLRTLTTTMVLASSAHAGACQMCTSTATYDALRFTPVFLFLALAWIPVAIAADNQAERSGVESRQLTRSILKYLGVAFALWVFMGLHLAIIAFFPLYLCGRVFGRHTDRPLPPVWVRRTAAAFLILMGLSVPLSYLGLPLSANETTARSRVSESKQTMRELAENLRSETGGKFPPALEGARAVDPFDYRLISIPPLVPAVMSEHFIATGHIPSAPFGYVTSGTGALIWSRGPDGDLDLQEPMAAAAIKTALESPIPELTSFTYDPTNGIYSDGDILQVY